MRLRSCIALEFLSGVSILAGLAFVGNWAMAEMGQGGNRAQAATASLESYSPPNQVQDVEPKQQETVEEPTSQVQGSAESIAEESSLNASDEVVVEPQPTPVSERKGMGSFLGVRDAVLLEPLRNSPIKQVKFNRGGSSVSMRIDFENGARAAFKPLQTNLQSVPRREVAAFRINRLLGLSSVPPAVGRQFSLAEIMAALHPDSRYYKPRLRAEVIQKGGNVNGELSWWIPVIARGRVNGYEMDSLEGIVSWKRYLGIRGKIPKKDFALVSQISSMVLFDFVINNPDRWTGGNARVSEDQKLLYFMDNTMSFGNNANGHNKARIYLERSQKFSKSLVERLRNLKEEEVREALSYHVEPFRFLLKEQEIKAMMSRRDLALAYIDRLIKRHGEEKILVFP